MRQRMVGGPAPTGHAPNALSEDPAGIVRNCLNTQQPHRGDCILTSHILTCHFYTGTAMPKQDTTDFSPPCHECGGRCCRYIAIGIDPPKNQTALHNIRWYLLHANVSVFVDHERAGLSSSPRRVRHRTKSRCTLYGARPRICRDYGTAPGDCEYYANPTQCASRSLKFDAWIERKAQAGLMVFREQGSPDARDAQFERLLRTPGNGPPGNS